VGGKKKNTKKINKKKTKQNKNNNKKKTCGESFNTFPTCISLLEWMKIYFLYQSNYGYEWLILTWFLNDLLKGGRGGHLISTWSTSKSTKPLPPKESNLSASAFYSSASNLPRINKKCSSHLLFVPICLS